MTGKIPFFQTLKEESDARNFDGMSEIVQKVEGIHQWKLRKDFVSGLNLVGPFAKIESYQTARVKKILATKNFGRKGWRGEARKKKLRFVCVASHFNVQKSLRPRNCVKFPTCTRHIIPNSDQNSFSRGPFLAPK